jgi:hypothetical protein
MKSKLLRVCESCAYFVGYSFMFCLCGLILWAIGFAFYMLFWDLVG